MTKKEAIESFKCGNKWRSEVEKTRMSSREIKELEFYIERDNMAIKALEQEPCEDIDFHLWEKDDMEEMKKTNDLPSVAPQPNKGHWIIKENGRAKCSKCLIVHPHPSIFCPSCGAMMIE